ncbi:AAA family ATPase [Tundrisphaera lichenicola]|uniref:ExeA family protein n=1 Tax=Tundrisphaera lichenicola TaxID=2029860 RepID=UPI003EBEE416
MDRPRNRTDADERGPNADPARTFVLPSRRTALDACRDALTVGPILLTGEAGIGKTWLWRVMGSESSPACRWLGIDLTPADGTADFYRLIGHRFGLLESGSPLTRIGLLDFLAERQVDGDRPVLVVDEAHNLSAPVWEEIRILINRLGEMGGFAGLMLVGQTPLVRQFATRPFASIEYRLAARVHLGRIDADEALELLTRFRPDRIWTPGEVELLHRDSGGNPGRLLRKVATSRLPGMDARSTPQRVAAPVRSAELPPDSRRPPMLVGSRPPLIVEDHLIEVGWSPEDDSPLVDDEESASANDPSEVKEDEEEVRDHYAALQAWQEWTANQSGRPVEREFIVPDDGDVEEEPEELDVPPSPLDERPMVRAEGEQRFAPFGQLFTRMSQTLEPD